jgi:hypothetical protein
MKSLFILLLGLCIGSSTTFANNADYWFAIRLADQPAGYQRLSTSTGEDGAIRTTDESLIVINRLGSRVEVRTKTETRETPAGGVLSVREESSSSQQTVVTEALCEADAISIVTTSGDNSYRRSVPNREPIYGPAHLARISVAGLAKPGDVVTCRMFLPSLGVHTFHRTLLKLETRDGQRLYHVKSALEGFPGDAAELLRADGTVMEVMRELPFGAMVASVTDREAALRSAIGGELPAEAYADTLARSNVRLPDPHTVERILVRITHRRPDYGWPVLQGPNQRVIEKTKDIVVLEFKAGGASQNRDAEIPDAPPGSNQILQADDAEVVRLTREIVGGERDPEKIILRLQDWVAFNMQFDTGVAVTPASEVVRNRRGTCVAYSVLLASMARAAGLPARVAMGCVYVSGAWGGHAWVDVRIGGTWRAIDAAVYQPGYADAARFQFDSYDFDDGGVAASFAGLQLYGNIDVTVLEYSAAGKNHVVGADAGSHVLEGDYYDNAWLGVRIRKPGSMNFVDLDAAYPDPTILGARDETSELRVALLSVGGHGDRVAREKLAEIGAEAPILAQELAGYAATAIEGKDKARLLCRRGQSLWMITTQGPDAAHLLRSVASGWTWTDRKL